MSWQLIQGFVKHCNCYLKDLSADFFVPSSLPQIPQYTHLPLLLWEKLCGLSPSLFLSQTLTAALHLKMHVPQKNGLVITGVRGPHSKDCSIRGFHFLAQCLFCSHISHCTNCWRDAHRLSLPPFPPLYSHLQSQSGWQGRSHR